jgi:hypothetical protein
MKFLPGFVIYTPQQRCKTHKIHEEEHEQEQEEQVNLADMKEFFRKHTTRDDREEETFCKDEITIMQN